jgi:DNA-binding NtrC family response regulator
MSNGSFRRDLYYRLGVVVLELPPLRHRRDDIPALAENYVSYLAPRIGVEPRRVSPEAIDALRNYAWPGNVRELANVIERALILCDDESIRLDHLPDEVAEASALAHHVVEHPATALANPEWGALSWPQARNQILERYEPLYLREILARAHGRIKDAAIFAGLTPRSLHYKMKRYGISKEEFRLDGGAAPTPPAPGAASGDS